VEVSVDTLKGWLAEAKSVVFLAGAGLSVASGIRPYRNAPNAIWAQYVTEWGTIAKFRDDPAEWWAKFWLEGHGDIFKHDIRPNPGHAALAKLCERDGALLITQNIDGLSRRAGHREDRLIEIHGRYDRYVCCDGCEGVETAIDLSRVREGVYPKHSCGAPLRPLVLLFDEYYDSHEAFQAHRARRAMNDAELIVFAGTSFSVGITDMALRAASVSHARVASINLEPAPKQGPRVLDVIGKTEDLLPQLI
jgi:NAD-dependent SIR2 family protein deacetylase